MDQVADCASLFPALTRDTSVFKIVEELGEVADAIIGIDGSNPRKGVYATEADLRKELLDVSLTALIAFVILTRDEYPAQSLLQHAAMRARRAREAVA